MSKTDSNAIPSMVGSGDMMATQEIHHFLLPVNPDEDTLAKYYKAVEEWNTTILPTLEVTGMSQRALMKPCYLLCFKSQYNIYEMFVMWC